MQVIGDVELIVGLGGLIDRHLFKAGDQIGCASQVVLQQGGGFIQSVDQFGQVAARELLLIDLALEILDPLLQEGGGGDADADRGVDLVGDPGDQ